MSKPRQPATLRSTGMSVRTKSRNSSRSFGLISNLPVTINIGLLRFPNQTGQKRIPLGSAHHVVQRNLVDDGVGVNFVAGTVPNAGNPGLAHPVNAVGREIPLACRDRFAPEQFTC